MRLSGTAKSVLGSLIGNAAAALTSLDVYLKKSFADAIVAGLAAAAEVSVGTYTGTGSAVTVNLDFDPKVVIGYNETDGDVAFLHISGASDGVTLKIVDSGSGTTDLSKASAGITLGAAGERKFTIGTDAALNENAKTYRYVAIGF